MKNLSKKVFYKLFCCHTLLFLLFFIPLFASRYFSSTHQIAIGTLFPYLLYVVFSVLIISSCIFLAYNYASLHKTLKPVVHMAEVGETARVRDNEKLSLRWAPTEWIRRSCKRSSSTNTRCACASSLASRPTRSGAGCVRGVCRTGGPAAPGPSASR